MEGNNMGGELISTGQNLPVIHLYEKNGCLTFEGDDGLPMKKDNSIWYRYRHFIRVSSVLLFTILSIIAGVLLVCLTALKPTSGICTQSFKRTTQSQIVYDANSQHVAVGNFNQDNLLDLVMANSGIGNVGVRLATGNDSSTVFIACYDPLYSIININLFTLTTSKDPGSLFSSSWNRYRYKSYTAAGC